MADRFPANIIIGGPVPRSCLDELFTLLNDLEEEYNSFCFELATEEDLLKALNDDGLFKGFRAEASYGCFYDLEAFLQEHKISYDRYSDPYYEYAGQQVKHRPDLKEPHICEADSEGEPYLSLSVLKPLLDKETGEAADLERLRYLLGLHIPALSPVTITD